MKAIQNNSFVHYYVMRKSWSPKINAQEAIDFVRTYISTFGLDGKSNKDVIVRQRQYLMALLCYNGVTLHKAGEIVFNKNHTTVRHALKTIVDNIDLDIPSFYEECKDLIKHSSERLGISPSDLPKRLKKSYNLEKRYF